MDHEKIFSGIKIDDEAIRASGFTPAFIQSCAQAAARFRTGLSFRDGNPPIPFGQYKPMSLKTKTAVSGVVPMMSARKIIVDPDLHRSGSKPLSSSYQRSEEERMNPLPRPLTYEQSKQESMKPSHNKGSLRLLFADKHTEVLGIENGYLLYKMKEVDVDKCQNADVARDTVYRIKLSEGKPGRVLTLQQKEALANTFRQNLEDVTVPEYVREMWNETEFGPIDLDMEYETYYKKPNMQKFMPEMVAGDPPFSGDADMFAVSIPLHLARTPLNSREFVKSPKQTNAFLKNIQKMKKIIRTKRDQKQLQKMWAKFNIKDRTYQDGKIQSTPFEKIIMKMKSPLKIINELKALINPKNIQGLATQYEFMVGASINSIAGSTVVGNLIDDMILHGPETNNPNHPSSLDDNILHFYDGNIYMTSTEDELVSFYMVTDYLDHHFQPVHPEWNMEKWGDVIEKQIRLGQADLINHKTLVAYIEYSVENLLPPPDFESKAARLKFKQSLEKMLLHHSGNNNIREYMARYNLHIIKRAPSRKISGLMKKFGQTLLPDTSSLDKMNGFEKNYY